MKRRFSFLVVIMMLFRVFSIGAFPESAPYGEEMTIYYSSLSPEEQELYDLIYEGVLYYDDVIGFPHGYPMEMVDKVVSIMMDDSPELFWLDHSWASSYYEDEPDLAVDVEIDYIMTEREALRRWNGILDFFDSIELEWDSDLIDEVIIMDALIENTEYVDGVHVHDASAAIVKGRAVCEGYAKAAALLLRLRGIPAGVIGGIGYSDGDGEPHAWNIVRIGSEWTLLDLTWSDDDYSSYYDWLNLSERQFRSTHHPENEPSFYREAGNTYEIARILELYPEGNVRSHFLRELERLIRDDIPVLIYFDNVEDYSYLLRNYDLWLDEYNEIHGKDGFYGSYVVSTDDDRLRFHLDWE